MSLYRQLWFALILTTALSLIGALLASTLSARAYLQEQLRLKNSDNATALALSLSRAGVDNIEIELAVAAMFDTGHYESIRVLDPRGNLMAERVAGAEVSQVPAWFADRLPIYAPAGEALISDGWKQIGSVSLTSHSKFAYAALWRSTIQMVLTLALAGALSGYLGTLILRRLKRPLDSVIEQAQAITERRFITAPEPSVPELRQLSIAMNSVVLRLKAMFEEEAQRLETVRKQANHDALTGLANRAYFVAHLSTLLESDEAPHGALLFIRIADLNEINRKLGRSATDHMLCAAADIVHNRARQNPDGLAARLNGADFALLLPGETPSQVGANELLTAFINALSAHAPEAKAFIGVSEYGFNMDSGSVFSRIDAALAEAETAGASEVRIASRAEGMAPRNAEQWADSLRWALTHEGARLASFPVLAADSSTMHVECPLRMRFSASGEWQTAGYFLPMAERLDRTADLDLAAARLGLERLRGDKSLPGLAINLSGRSIQHLDFRKRLAELLAGYADVSPKLWLEVSENGALSQVDSFSKFCEEMRPSRCKIGIEHFGRQFSQIGQFHGLGIDYLKIDASFVRNVDTNSGNQLFLKGLRSIAQTAGFILIAEGVVSSGEHKTLRELGFDGFTGPMIKEGAVQDIRAPE